MDFKDFLAEVRELYPDATVVDGDLVVFSYEVPVGGRVGDKIKTRLRPGRGLAAELPARPARIAPSWPS